MPGVMRKTVGMKQATKDYNPSAEDVSHKAVLAAPKKKKKKQSMAEVMEEARRRETPPGKPGLGRGRIF